MKKEEIKEMIEKSVFVIDIFLSSNSKTCTVVQRRVYTHSSIQTVDSFFMRISCRTKTRYYLKSKIKILTYT